MSHTEASLLHGGCTKTSQGENVVFVTLAHTQIVSFVRYDVVVGARIRTFGELWDERLHRATMLFDGRGFPFPSPLPGGPRRPVDHGPPYYGYYGISGDPLGIAAGECPLPAD